MDRVISNPINSNQIVGLDIDLKCLINCDCKDCKSLNEILQLIVDKLCKDEIKIEDLDTRCLDGSLTSNQQLIQSIINKLDCSTSSTDSTTPTNPLGLDISGLNLCDDDLWACNNTTPCLFVKDSCGNPVSNYTIKDVLQTIIKRLLSYQKAIKALCDENEALKTRLNNLELRLTNIENNCCNTSLVNRITLLESSVTTIQTNCC